MSTAGELLRAGSTSAAGATAGECLLSLGGGSVQVVPGSNTAVIDNAQSTVEIAETDDPGEPIAQPSQSATAQTTGPGAT
jgi:hypothetical protein